MRQVMWVVVSLLGMVAGIAAKGTPVGTDINNTAQIAYAVGGIDYDLNSTTDRFVVDRVVDIHVAWEDSAPVEVYGGDTERVLTFVLANQGNGDENITLAYEHNTSSDFTPQGVWIYRDEDNNSIFDPTVDTNLTRVVLGADRNVTLFLVGTIPDDNTTAPGNRSHEILRADTERNATAGTDRPDQVDTVVRTGKDQDTGSWLIRDYWLVAEKNATVHTDDNATHTGSRITYTIDTHIGGKAAGRHIDGVVVSDVIPAGTRYLPGSLRLDATALTDKADGDAGEANATVVTVRVGTLSGTTHRTMQFDVEVE